eukprot:jgi/Galph1/3548/GphlegSOOS_G2238.1
MFSVASFLIEPNTLNSDSQVPAAKFFENIDKVIEDNGGATKVFQCLEQLYTRYKILNSSLMRQKKSFQDKIPDLCNALEVIGWLRSRSMEEEEKGGFETTFELADNIYVSADVTNPQVICLWLGANVMVEYSFEEAEKLLQENLDGANERIQQLDKELSFLREQMTTTEVNISRVYGAQLAQQQQQ